MHTLSLEVDEVNLIEKAGGRGCMEPMIQYMTSENLPQMKKM